MKKIYFFLVTMMVALSAHAGDWYLRGGFNSWGTGDKFVEQADGKFLLENVTITANSELKVDDGNWGTSYGEWDGYAKNMTAGNSYKCHSGGGNMSFGSPAFTGDVYFWIDGTEGWAYIQFGENTGGGEETPQEISYAIHGSFTGSWVSTDHTENNGLWEISDFEVKNGSAEFGIKKMTNGSQTDWYAASSDTTVSGATSLTLVTSNTQNIKIKEGTYNFSFNPENGELVVTVPTPEPALTTYTVKYNNGMTQWDNVYVTFKNGDQSAEATVEEPGGDTGDSMGATFIYTASAALAWEPATVVFSNGTIEVEEAFENGKLYGKDYQVLAFMPFYNDNYLYEDPFINDESMAQDYGYNMLDADGNMVWTISEWKDGDKICVMVHNIASLSENPDFYGGVELANKTWNSGLIAYNYDPYSADMTLPAAVGKEVTFKFNTATNQLYVEFEEDVEPEPVAYLYSLCQANTRMTSLSNVQYTNEEAYVSYGYNLLEDGVATWSVDNWNADQAFVIGVMASNTEVPVVLGGVETLGLGEFAELTEYGVENIATAGIKLSSSANGKTVKFTFDAEYKTISVEYAVCQIALVNEEYVNLGEPDTIYTDDPGMAADRLYTLMDNGVATWTVSNWAADQQFSICDYNTYDGFGGVEIQNNVPATLVLGNFEESLMVLPADAAGVDVTFSFNVNTNQLTVSYEPATEPAAVVYLMGLGADWENGQAAEVDATTNCATWTIDNWAKGSEFKFKVDGNWYGYTSDVVNGEWYETYDTGMVNTTLPASATGKTVTITFANDNKNFKAEWSETLYTVYGLINATSSKALSDVYYGTENGLEALENGVATWTVENWSNSTSFAVMAMTNTNATDFFGGAGEVEDYAVLENMGAAMTQAAMTLPADAEGKTVTFAYNTNTWELTVSYQHEKVLYTVSYNNAKTNWDEVYIYLWKGDVNNVWPCVKMTAPEEGSTVWTYSVELDWKPDFVIFSNGVAGNQTDDLEFINGKVYGEEHSSLVLDLENADDVEYYTIQGIKVTNPGKGLYIRKQNGKTTKVML